MTDLFSCDSILECDDFYHWLSLLWIVLSTREDYGSIRLAGVIEKRDIGRNTDTDWCEGWRG